MHRLFVAIRPPEGVRDRLIDLMDDGLHVRWQSDDQLHLTLRFVGEVERPVAEDLATELERIRFAGFSLALSGVGKFEKRRHGALWAGIEPKEPVKALAAKIERACQSVGIEAERRAFHPHITLARWNGRAPGLDRFLEQHGGLISDPWEAKEFILYESHLGRAGPHYEPTAEYRLS